jgi:hypothetical protein
LRLKVAAILLFMLQKIKMLISMAKAFLYLKQNLEVRQAQIIFNFVAYLLILLFAIFIAGKDFCTALI